MSKNDDWLWVLLVLALPFLLASGAGQGGVDEVSRKRRISNWIGVGVLLTFVACIFFSQVTKPVAKPEQTKIEQKEEARPKPVPVQAKAEAKEPRLSEPKPVAEKNGWHFNFKWGGK